MKLTKIISASAALLMAFSVAGCKLEEDALNMLNPSGDNCTIDFTNDGSKAKYARAFLTTKTAHLSADMAIEIDTKKTTNGATTTGYIFNVSGSGTEKDPYSFCLVGIRKYGNQPQYFASYYTGVLSADCTSDKDDFDTGANKAYEYVLSDDSKSWKTIPTGSYTESDGKLKVYIAVTAMNGSTEITEDNYNKPAANGSNQAETNENKADALKVTLKASKESSGGKEITYNLANVNAGKNKGGKNSPELTEFPVKQNKLGFYAMVLKNQTLSAKWTRDNFVAASEVIEE